MTGYTFNQLFDFTRTTAGTFVGSNGLIQTTPASVNLLTFTQEFDNAAWVKAGATVSANTAIAPDGTATADKMVETATTAPHAVYQVFTYGAGLVYAATVYAKKAERNWIYVGADTAAAEAVFFDLDTGTVGSQGTGYVGSITNAGDGWYRCTVITTQSTALPPNFLVVGLASANGTPSYAGNGTSGAFIWGAQLELGSTATTYARNNGGLFPPRFDYDPVTLAPRGILIEEQRTNLLLNSVFGGAVSGTPGTAPTSWGSFTNGSIVVASLGRNFAANSIRITTTSARHFYSQTVALAATGTWIITFKVNVGTAVRIDELLAFNTRPAGSTIQYFYNDAAQIASYVPPTGNGILQVTVTTTGTSGNAEIRFGCGASNAVTADVTFWDAQWELGTFATSYIPTVASQVTRTADVCTISAPMFAPWYNQGQGTFVVDVGRFSSVNSTATAAFLSATDNPASNDWILMFGDGLNTTAQYFNSGTTQASIPLSQIASGGKMSFAYALNDFAANVNGGAVSTDTSGTLSTDITALRIGAFAANPNFLNGHIRRITYYPFRASNNQLQALST